MKGSSALAFFMALLSAALLAACEGPVASHGASRSPLPRASAPDPDIKESVTAAPAFDVGHTVHITTGGIRPRSLASQCCAPITFKNETDKPMSIVFYISKIDSGPIPPGGSWQWTPPNPESVGYHLGSDPNQSGHIQVEAADW